MTIASVTTDINIGPFKIPSNAQNMIMNFHANKNNLSVEMVIPEPIMSYELLTTRWLHKEYKFSKIILCSIHQLPQKKEAIDDILINMKNIEFHFAIEGLIGNNINFLLKCINEARIFMDADQIDSQKNNWLDLYNLYKNG
jgi:sporadic carbohydrate cluster protein (TIGR04323 family)